jgi:hypothetical protein
MTQIARCPSKSSFSAPPQAVSEGKHIFKKIDNILFFGRKWWPIDRTYQLQRGKWTALLTSHKEIASNNRTPENPVALHKNFVQCTLPSRKAQLFSQGMPHSSRERFWVKNWVAWSVNSFLGILFLPHTRIRLPRGSHALSSYSPNVRRRPTDQRPQLCTTRLKSSQVNHRLQMQMYVKKVRVGAGRYF